MASRIPADGATISPRKSTLSGTELMRAFAALLLTCRTHAGPKSAGLGLVHCIFSGNQNDAIDVARTFHADLPRDDIGQHSFWISFERRTISTPSRSSITDRRTGRQRQCDFRRKLLRLGVGIQNVL